MSLYSKLVSGMMISDRYRIDRVLGKGRSATVYRAEDTQSNSPVVLKVLDPLLAQDSIEVERFKREAQILRSISDPRIIRIFDLIRDQGLIVIVMEYFEGEDLKSRLSRGALPLPLFVSAALKIAEALRACHAAKVLHRDLKPQNILIDPNGEIRLMDFGISKMTQSTDLTKTGTAIGTPEYMAPEMYSATRADRRSDVYSLGAVFYEMLAGRPPVTGSTIAEVMTRQMSGEIPPLRAERPEIPAGVEALILRCLRLDPAFRYATVDELLNDLRSAETLVTAYVRSTAPVCIRCKCELFPGLAFCYGCREFTQEALEPGEYSVVLYRGDHLPGLADFLHRCFPSVPSKNFLSRMRKLPVLLFRGLSQRSALSLQNELSSYPCDLGVLKNLPTELLLSRTYVLWALAGSLPVFAIPFPVLQLAALAAVEFAIFASFHRRTVPLISLKGLRDSSRAEPPLLRQYGESIKAVRNASARAILAGTLATYARIERRIDGGGPATIAVCLEEATKSAIALDRISDHLKERSSRFFRDRIRVIDEAMAKLPGGAEFESLSQRKAKLSQEWGDYVKMEEDFERLHDRLLEILSEVKKYEFELSVPSRKSA